MASTEKHKNKQDIAMTERKEAAKMLDTECK